MDWTRFAAALFDLDGVITDTAEVHMRAWDRLFNEFLTERGITEPYTSADYFEYVDGRPRYDGVRAFLASRGIDLEFGEPTDDPSGETVCALGNRKNGYFTEQLATGVRVFDGTVALIEDLTERGKRLAVVSSSRNAKQVLAAVGLLDRFELIIDGEVASSDEIAGKPAPDTYLAAANRLGVPAVEAVVFEDAVSGVQAGAAGNFGLVVGVNRGVGADVLRANGADVVVDDLAELR